MPLYPIRRNVSDYLHNRSHTSRRGANEVVVKNLRMAQTFHKHVGIGKDEEWKRVGPYNGSLVRRYVFR
ncbi:hypothetical protein M404DRAFT_1007405 [Pisolithus tinctorius Marx 270]|uniref:Uncharacterized protein n=1 Tax=Pisolithus tinctorius Marx 270 TaxID=870435 RepID=A0A0C3JCX5_PISTI|nr:hypothetical protein M404DRAFT_1007405 [Pisolithus tinctorius Marx 270]